jgi:hypothetical protein
MLAGEMRIAAILDDAALSARVVTDRFAQFPPIPHIDNKRAHRIRAKIQTNRVLPGHVRLSSILFSV